MFSVKQNTTPAASLMEPYGASQQGNYVYHQYSAADANREGNAHA